MPISSQFLCPVHDRDSDLSMRCRSTDGHTGEHSFNLRRGSLLQSLFMHSLTSVFSSGANLALLPLIKHRQGLALLYTVVSGRPH